MSSAVNAHLLQQQQHPQCSEALQKTSDVQFKGNSSARIVPGGKVYRQLFEAQVNLLKQSFKIFIKII